ncbi:MAG: Coenzyme F420 hydrogenase/dehydrogenase, beta subunit C-terminal domain [Anaerolineae bacterium]
MKDTESKMFLDLQEEVIRRGLCTRCGGCISFCSAGGLNALELDEDGLPRFAGKERCLRCGICYMICPLTDELDVAGGQEFSWDAAIGPYQDITSARATDEAIRRAATDGGVVTALLLYMLEQRLIDGAIVSRRTATFGRQPLVATTREEIISAAGSQFSGTPHLEQLGGQYTTYSPTISAVKSLEGKRLNRVALVGTPCQMRTVRKMQCLSVIPSEVITYTIGLFCMENFTFTALASEKLPPALADNLENVVKLNIKEDLIVTLRDGTVVHVPLDQLDGVARPACLACTEFANEYADIAVGGLGSPDGYTTALIRTNGGRRIFGEALRQGYIEERMPRKAMETRAEKAQMLAKVLDFARRKRERGEARRRKMALGE